MEEGEDVKAGRDLQEAALDQEKFTKQHRMWVVFCCYLKWRQTVRIMQVWMCFNVSAHACMPRSLQMHYLERIPLTRRFLKGFFSWQSSNSTLAQPLQKMPLCTQSALTLINPNLCRMETKYEIEKVTFIKHRIVHCNSSSNSDK